jgi:hypothetical protein
MEEGLEGQVLAIDALNVTSLGIMLELAKVQPKTRRLQKER